MQNPNKNEFRKESDDTVWGYEDGAHTHSPSGQHFVPEPDGKVPDDNSQSDLAQSTARALIASAADKAEANQWLSARTRLEHDLLEPPPEKIGRFQIIERIDGGGQADVLRAVDPATPGRDVILKWARADTPRSQHQRIIDEANTMMQLELPGIPTIYGVGWHDERPFVAREFLRGQPLTRILQQRHRIPVDEAVDLLTSLAETLHAVHKNGIIHRDIKPGNIIVSTDGSASLVDFGLSWSPQRAETDREEGIQDTTGTPRYMAPEQESTEDKIGPWTDVFGLGAVMFEVLTGHPIDRTSEPINLEMPDQAIEIPKQLKHICARALEIRPRKRYQSAQEMAHDLRAPKVRRRNATWGLLAAVAIVLLGASIGLASLAGVWFSRPQPVALGGEFHVRIWSPSDGNYKKGQLLGSPGTIPANSGDQLQISLNLNRPAYVYLVWINPSGELLLLHPQANGDLSPISAKQEPIQFVRSPSTAASGWTLDESEGVETILALVSDMPLKEGTDLNAFVSELEPKQNTQADHFTTYDVVNHVHRGVTEETIDSYLTQLVTCFEDRFELIKVIRFSHLDSAKR